MRRLAGNGLYWEANRWNLGKFVLGGVCAISLARVGLALLVLSGAATFPEAFPRITDKPIATLVLNGVWAAGSAILF
jgi:hypothetical protein